MSGINVRSSYGKLQQVSNQDKDLRLEFFVTGQPVGSARRALDVMPLGAYLYLENGVVEAGSDSNQVRLSGHNARKGDIFRIKTSANSIQEFEVHIDEIVDANNFKLACVLSANLQAGDTCDLLRPVVQRMSESGSTLAELAASPMSYLSFIRDGVLVQVEEDTLAPANNIPLPVKLISTGGEVTINAGDLHVELSHLGPNYDSTRIGDGTHLMAVNASNEATVHDASVLQELVDSKAVLDSSLQALLDILSDFNVLNMTDFATEAKQDSMITLLTNLSAKFGSLGQKFMAGSAPVVIASDQSAIPASQSGTWNITNISGTVSLPTGAATAANQSTANSSLSSIDSKLSSQATAANQATEITALQNIDSDLGAPADTAVTNPASSASVIAALKGLLTLITSSNTKLDTIDANTSPALNSSNNVTSAANTLTSAPAGAIGMIIQNSTQAASALRFTAAATTPTASVGYYLEPGQSTSYMAAGNVRTISVDGGAIDACILWFV